MVCDVAEIAAGAGLVWARRDGAGVPVAAAVAGVAAVGFAVLAAVVPSALSVLTALVPVDVAVPSSAVSAAAFVSVPSSALPVSLVASACACCSAVAGGCMASAMAGVGNVALIRDVHAIAQSR